MTTDDGTAWQAVQDEARKMANRGQHAEGLAHLLNAASTPASDLQLAAIFQYASTHGQYEQVLDLAEAYAEGRKSRLLRHRFCNAWALDVLRKAGRFDTVLDMISSFEPDQMAVPLFYHHLATALHDEAFLRAVDGDPRLEKLFVLSVEQAHIDQRTPSEFILRNSTQFIAAPQAYTTFLLIHRRLMTTVLDRLSQSKNVLLVRLQLNAVEGLSGKALVTALADATPREVSAIWTMHKARLHQLMRLFYIDGSFEYAASHLAPQIILTFEKLGVGHPDTALTLIVENWVDRIAQRYEGHTGDMPTGVLDQLAILHKARAPQVYDWYIANRPNSAELSGLRIFNPERSFPAPRLSPDRKPRVAVCISGQLRGYKLAFPKMQRHLLANTEPVIFVDAWRKIGRKTPTPAQAWRMFDGEFLNAYQSVANNMGYPAMQARYPALTTLDDASNVDAQALADFYGCPIDHVRVEDDETGAFVHYSNPQKMYHKIQGAQALLESSGIDADAVLRIRPDKNINGAAREFDWHRMIDTSLNDRVFYADFPYRTHPSSGLVIGDQAGIATMELMHVYANARDTTVEAGKLGWEDWPAQPRAHANLSHALWLNGVRVDTMPVQWGNNFDPDRLSSAATLALVEQDISSRTPDSNDDRLVAAARADLAK
ncbi:hypothetical protein [Tropicibacter oceani]|uniref:Uncharacterized protein n=1 Tax=Tropicibacter oceani TaxID=3058420 RepID=A0ABY8QN63_9RHOB|nr:hypothetical protein [Tropicibacter oceani]WGW06064.1 hypothetical protein QF118_19655 [Tropicibacter oceani]